MFNHVLLLVLLLFSFATNSSQAPTTVAFVAPRPRVVRPLISQAKTQTPSTPAPPGGILSRLEAAADNSEAATPTQSSNTGDDQILKVDNVEHGGETSEVLSLLLKAWSLFRIVHKQVQKNDPADHENNDYNGAPSIKLPLMGTNKNNNKNIDAVSSLKSNIQKKNLLRPKQPTPAFLSAVSRFSKFPNKSKNRRRWTTRWTRSQALRHLSQWAFDVCDTDDSGRIDEKAFYTGLLLVHLNLAKYVGVASCYPPNRTQVAELFALADQDRSGSLNEQEFTDAVVVCCARITSRIVIYYSIVILAIPMLVSRGMQVVASMFHPSLSLPSSWMKLVPWTTVMARPWVGQLLAVLEWSLQHFVTLAFFSILVPVVFTRIDERSRRLVKKRRNPKYWWEQWGKELLSTSKQVVATSKVPTPKEQDQA